MLFKLCKISTFNCLFLSLLILLACRLTTIAFTDTHSFGLVWPRNMNNISNESLRHPLVEWLNNAESHSSEKSMFYYTPM